jgi:ubiquilin
VIPQWSVKLAHAAFGVPTTQPTKATNNQSQPDSVESLCSLHSTYSLPRLLVAAVDLFSFLCLALQAIGLWLTECVLLIVDSMSGTGTTVDDSHGFSLTIRTSNGDRFDVLVTSSNDSDPTVRDVKAAIAARPGETVPMERLRLIYKGRILENESHVSHYAILPRSTLFLVKSSGQTPTVGSGNATTSSHRTASTGVISSGTVAPTVPPPLFQTAPPLSSSTNPWGLANVNNSAGAFPPGMMPPTDPQQLEAMMNSPMMQSLLDNPELMQNMMQAQMRSNPQMRQMMEANPQLQHVLNDPQVLRDALRVMRNPAARQQAMRNQDLALSQLENMPGGFAALSSMYRDVQQPMEEASVLMNHTESARTADPAHTQAGASGTAMPNPWGSNNTRASPAASNATAHSNSSSNSNANNAATNPFLAAMGGNRNAASSANNNTGTTAHGTATTGNPWAGTGMPGFPSSLQQPPSPDQANLMMNLLDNPAVTQMMQNALEQNPDMFRTMLEQQNPMLRSMFANNPEAGNDFIRQMMNPQMLRTMMQLQQNMGGMNPGSMMMPPVTPATNPSLNNTSTGLDFSSLLQGSQGASRSNATATNPWAFPTPSNIRSVSTPVTAAPAADRYRTQLRSLYDMGFDDEARNVAALERVHGNLNRAVDALLSSPPPTSAATSAPAPSAGNEDSGPPPEEAPKGSQEKKND